MKKLTYALAGVEPAPFPYGELRVINLDTGQEVSDVVECDAAEGWLVSYKRNREGQFYADPGADEAAKQVVRGRFEIVRLS